MFSSAGQSGGLGQGGMSMIMLVAMLAIFYFFAIKPQKKREKEINDMRNSLRTGDDITTIGGIEGKISQVKEDYVVVDVKPNKVRMQVAKWAVASVNRKSKEKAELFTEDKEKTQAETEELAEEKLQ